jgi:cyclopropane fatty-acyl-phospholipid synthase-like methyltransferase
MFEHMKGYPALFGKLSTWLQPGGKVFIHVFCHRDTPYEFEDDDGWMSKTFFSGGTMPSVRSRFAPMKPALTSFVQLDLFTYFQKHLTLLHSDFIPGTHYAQTLESWLKLQDKNAKEGLKILEEDAEAKGFGREEGRKSFYRYVLSGRSYTDPLTRSLVVSVFSS